MTKAEFLTILDKHLDGTATEEERRLLDNFYRHHLAAARTEWAFTDKERIRVELLASLNRAIEEDVRRDHPARVGVKTWRIAASVALVLAAGLWLYLSRIDAPEVQYLTATAKRGEQITVTLSDGSVVRLNAESSIAYPEQLTSSETRSVQLSGEAFFDVARDETKPFVIHSGDLVTTVLGTSFNIRAYPEDETFAVTVASGKVRVDAANNQNQKTASELLFPGEQALFEKSTANITRKRVDPEKHLAWKEGTILLEGASLQEATDILGRWFDVEFVFENPALKTCTIDGKFRNDKLGNILENLRFLMGIEYRMEGDNKVFIDGKSCH
ncbi:MAG: FecR domain-containing protein [Bacteroidota bacterium]|nr:FecR domain-containing protein [Bacteroidota bacterium]